MNTKRLALDYLRKVRTRKKALELFFQENSYDDVVRESQEIVELVLKGTLRFIGIDPPKVHDVGKVLNKHKDKLPEYWREKIDRITEISKTLYEERGHAFYGDESELVPASELFGRDEAQKAMDWVQEMIELYERLLSEG